MSFVFWILIRSIISFFSFRIYLQDEKKNEKYEPF